MPKAELSQLLLESRHLKMLQDLLQQHIPDCEVWAYVRGSEIND